MWKNTEEQWAAIYAAASGEQLGIRLFAQGSRMGRFPDSLGASAKKVNDAVHRFKKCASDTS